MMAPDTVRISAGGGLKVNYHVVLPRKRAVLSGGNSLELNVQLTGFKSL